MAKNLASSIIGLLDAERVDLRAAAATVLAAVGGGDRAIEEALTARLADSDGGVRRIALEGLAAMGATGFAPQLVPLLRGDDEVLAERAAQLLADAGAAAEGALRKELASGAIGPRRVIAQLLLRRTSQPAVEAVLDQLADPEFGEQALQLVRHELDRGADKLAALVDKLAGARAPDAAKRLAKAWAAASKPAKPAKAGKGAKAAKVVVAPVAADPLRVPEVAHGIAELGSLLRLIGYLARPTSQGLLLKFAADDQPRPIRLAAIAGLRRIVASSEVKGTEKVIEALIELADDASDLAVAQSAVDTLRGARIPESLSKPFAALAKSKHVAAQKLAMERLPAGGGAAAVKALIDALGASDPTARDAAARGLAKAPEAVLPLTRALLATRDEQVARRYASALRSHRGHVSTTAIDELAARLRETRGKPTADQLVLERVIAELVADVAPAVHVELLFERARKLQRAGKSIEAFGSLKPLLRSRADLDAAIDDEQRFLLAVLALEAAGDGIIRATRTDDPVFEQFARLAAKGYPVAQKLARAKDVTDEAIYALGFRLLESGDDLGAELLQGIIDERPRSKLAKSARNKLKLTGHAD